MQRVFGIARVGSGILGAIAAALTTFSAAVPLQVALRPDFGTPSRPSRRAAPRRWRVRGARLNRSQNWPYAATYKEARAMSPFPNRPVR